MTCIVVACTIFKNIMIHYEHTATAIYIHSIQNNDNNNNNNNNSYDDLPFLLKVEKLRKR